MVSTNIFGLRGGEEELWGWQDTWATAEQSDGWDGERGWEWPGRVGYGWIAEWKVDAVLGLGCNDGQIWESGATHLPDVVLFGGYW